MTENESESGHRLSGVEAIVQCDVRDAEPHVFGNTSMLQAERYVQGVKQNTPRCRLAISFGGNLHTRCMLDHGHGKVHIGRGLAQFAYQRIEWMDSDRRAYETDRDDEVAWEAAAETVA